MLKKITVSCLLVTSTLLWANPAGQMNEALSSLSELLPFITGDENFAAKENEKKIAQNLERLSRTFKNLKHEQMLKNDIFAPSYQTINQHLDGTKAAFQKGNKDYAQWRLKELTSLCLDCHSRMPESYSSRYQDGKMSLDMKKFKNTYNLGIGQLLVRQYQQAIWTFTKVIDDSIVTKDYRYTEKALKQLLLIRVKILSEFESMAKTVEHYQKQTDFPNDIKDELKAWGERLTHIRQKKALTSPSRSDSDIQKIIKDILVPLKAKESMMLDNFDVDLLAASGHMSRYLFEHQDSALAPDIIYWLGWSEKVLRRENFFGSGDLFLKQCIRHYSERPIAKECFKEYKESVEFEFSGSSGTHIPADVKNELDELGRLVDQKKK